MDVTGGFPPDSCRVGEKKLKRKGPPWTIWKVGVRGGPEASRSWGVGKLLPREKR